MRYMSLRVALVVLVLAGQGGAGFWIFRTEQAIAREQGSLRTLIDAVGRVETTIGELRGAQAGMVAHGQDRTFWLGKVQALTGSARSAMAGLDRASLAPAAAREVSAADEAFAAFGRVSGRVRQCLAADEPLTASSLVFGEASRSLASTVTALGSARTLQASSLDGSVARSRPLEAYAAGGALGLTAIVLLLLLARVGPPRIARVGDDAAPERPSMTTPELEDTEQESPALDIDLRSPREAPAVDARLHGRRDAEAAAMDDFRRNVRPEPRRAAPVDLGATALLCGDLARIEDARELRDMLARAAGLLDASGVVVWLGDAQAGVLRPTFSHGYTEHTLARMQALPVGDANAVSTAFRTARGGIVEGRAGRSGAIVTPITTAAGCAGVMAAEIRHGAELDANVQALAAIIAAQLATLVADTSPAARP